MAGIRRIFDILENYKQKYPDLQDALAGKVHKTWIKYSVNDYIENSNYVTVGLLELGLKKGDKIAIISSSMPEWNFLDMGSLQAGIVNVPIYPTISESEHKYIINHCEAKYIFTSGYDMLRRVETILPECKNIKKVYTLNKVDGYDSIYNIIELGKKNIHKYNLSEIKDSINEEDIATLIYTSGTTGIPKGVLLSHSNLVSNFLGVSHIPPFIPGDRALSYLPLCHVYERMIIYMYQYLGISLYYAESIPRISQNFLEVKPAVMCSVPRLIEKTFDKFLTTGNKLKGIKKTIFFWALKFAEEFSFDKQKNVFYKFKHFFADKLVYSQLRKALGGNIKIIVAGGAAITEKLVRIFTCAGVYIFPGYGLTETSPVIAVSTFRPNQLIFHAVGGVMPQNEVKIASDNEILTRGPSVMKGYYKDEELTKQSIDEDGWFYTGDIGKIIFDNTLVISGRKKSIFKNSFGKYINPDYVENKLKESLFIDNAMVVGENEKYCAALITPNFMHLNSWCLENNYKFDNFEEMVASKEVIKKYKEVVLEINQDLSSTEKVSNFVILPTEWTIDSGELSAALKIKRAFLFEKYTDKISSLFETKNNKNNN